MVLLVRTIDIDAKPIYPSTTMKQCGKIQLYTPHIPFILSLLIPCSQAYARQFIIPIQLRLNSVYSCCPFIQF